MAPCSASALQEVQPTESSAIVLCNSRAAPPKETSLARLELLPCIVAARMYESVRRELAEDISVQFWTDSMIALHRITGDPNKSKGFIRYTVTEILSKMDLTMWRHCRGKQNPADFLTRGVSARELKENSSAGQDQTGSHAKKLNGHNIVYPTLPILQYVLRRNALTWRRPFKPPYKLNHL
ncbi:hypothetical protein HPB50_026460 [Hyalomma asiaticum]|uniref:Uncharacterized protein n=1 Tax=Hyalomma asiaticum TaxID=266040 RepID=A0ACB7T2Q3_HYAAI|nr:hypothetical protein HPB50_026460 [Hyalomma asiaticum]